MVKVLGRAQAGRREGVKMLLEFGEDLGGLEASLGLGSGHQQACVCLCVSGNACVCQGTRVCANV